MSVLLDKITVKKMNKKLRTWIITLVLFSFKVNLIAQDLQFNPPATWECEKPGVYSVSGKHDHMDKEFVWLFLKDSHANLYMQYPPIEFLYPETWEVNNIRINSGNTDLLAIQVNKKGNKELLEWKEKSRWGAIEFKEVKNLPGYKILTAARIVNLSMSCKDIDTSITLPPSVRKEPDLQIHSSINEKLIVADFEIESSSKGYPMGGAISSWESDTNFEVKLDTFQLPKGPPYLGKYTLSIKHSVKLGAPKADWRGGGLVIQVQKEDKPLDISEYGYLEFDIRAISKSLETLKVKLQDPKSNTGIELLLKDYEVKFSREWEHVKIPLRSFTKMKIDYPPHWKKVNLKQVNKIVFVGIQDQNAKNFNGQILIDNIVFSK
ncbi:MAG: carbohydrate binding domain-containing protein [Bacteroidia bacterium]|nr:carbohydrate binding domain-containing protein [Bacteroidia bacterium]